MLKEVIHDDLIKVFPTPQSLKKYLDIDISDKVSVDSIPLIEEKLKDYKISVCGDHIYTSCKNSNLEIRLRLYNEYYEVYNKNNWKPYGSSKHQRKPLVHSKKCIDNNYKVYDGEKYRYINKQKFSELRENPRNSEWVLIMQEDDTLKQTYSDFVRIADEMFHATNGEINMYKTGRPSVTALNCFHKLTKFVQPEPIDQDEAKFIRNATLGPVIFSTKYTGEAYKYDVSSFYPSILSSQTFLVPIKRGTFTKLSNEEINEAKYFNPGICRAIITGEVGQVFRKNKLNYYTHYDLTTAKEMGLTIELIDDDQPNALIYGADQRVSGSKIFKKFIDTLFKLKQDKIEIAKKILNSLWGILCEENRLH